MSGLLITFEGVEGAGKSTQIALLRDRLVSRGITVFACREPGGTPAGESIRSILLSTENPVVPQAELLLFLAARAQIVETVIRPRLESGEVVLCDRFVDSTTAYQGHARSGDLDLIRRLNHYATDGLKPNLTVLLDLDPALGLARQPDHNRMEQESLAFHIAVRNGFLEMASAEPERFLVLDASGPIAEIHAAITARLESILCAYDSCHDTQ